MLNKKILSRIEALGGDISQVKGSSLADDLSAITFNSPLYLYDDAFEDWELGEDDEPIYGLNDFIEEHQELYKQNKEDFYQKLVNRFYAPTKEPIGAQWIGQPFTPPFEEFIHLLANEGYPDTFYVAMNDPHPENPIVFSTDHEEFFSEVSNEGKLEKFLKNFITPEELMKIIKEVL